MLLLLGLRQQPSQAKVREVLAKAGDPALGERREAFDLAGTLGDIEREIGLSTQLGGSRLALAAAVSDGRASEGRPCVPPSRAMQPSSWSWMLAGETKKATIQPAYRQRGAAACF